MIPYTLTNDTITVIVDGKPHTVQQGTPQFHGLRSALFDERWDAIKDLVSVSGALQQWLGDKFVVDGKAISYEGAVLPQSLVNRIWTMASAGESPGPLFAFYERLNRNPSRRSVTQLFEFLKYAGIPIEPDGTFLAYKGVQMNFLDAHSSTFNNEPGQTMRMPRNQISDDPNHACHEGFHVGALSYANSFSQRVVICRIDPEHVVSVPYEYSCRKMRVCEYEVIANWVADTGMTHYNDAVEPTELMPNTTLTVDVVKDDPEWGGDVEGEDENAEESVELAQDAMNDDAVGADDDQMDRGEVVEPEPQKITRVSITRVSITHKPTAPKAASFNRMNPGKLMLQSIDDLRKYASAHLKILGASKLPGGKSALVGKILKARKRKQR